MTATMTQTQKSEAKTYIPPTVSIGQIVHWFVEGNRRQTPCPAIVTGLGTKSIELSLIAPNYQALVPKSGVRHCDDPEAREVEFRASGSWDHTPETKKIASMMIDMGVNPHSDI
jgi:hypothetical protein